MFGDVVVAALRYDDVGSENEIEVGKRGERKVVVADGK